MPGSLIFILFVVMALGSPYLTRANLPVNREQWLKFKRTYNKHYNYPAEEMKRLKIYLENIEHIAKHNALYVEGKVTFRMGENEFADLTREEYLARVSGLNRTVSMRAVHGSSRAGKVKGSTFIPPANYEIPASLDWRTLGAVTNLKMQGSCGACWAFAAVGALEGQHYRKTGELIALSEQDLIDCSRPYGTLGCKSGWMNDGYRYAMENGGLNSERTYPYRVMEAICSHDANRVAASVTGYVDIEQGNDRELLEAVASVGPIAVGLDCTQIGCQYYSGGIYEDPSCTTHNLNHAMVLIGYGTDNNGVDYWLLKNSWGSGWGERGYIRIARNKRNHCGISSAASYPMV